MSKYIFVTNIFEYSNIWIYSSHSGSDWASWVRGKGLVLNCGWVVVKSHIFMAYLTILSKSCVHDFGFWKNPKSLGWVGWVHCLGLSQVFEEFNKVKHVVIPLVYWYIKVAHVFGSKHVCRRNYKSFTFLDNWTGALLRMDKLHLNTFASLALIWFELIWFNLVEWSIMSQYWPQNI